VRVGYMEDISVLTNVKRAPVLLQIQFSRVRAFKRRNSKCQLPLNKILAQALRKYPRPFF
jgi:hypothetical protein